MNTANTEAYQFRIAGHLDGSWSRWFGLAITYHDDGTCILTGTVADQAQLHGILAKLRDTGATLLSFQRLGYDSSSSSGSTRD